MKKPGLIQSATRFSLGALSIGILAACGGGGGLDVADGGIRGTGSSVGPVSGFGSVFVNGVRFEIQGVNNPVRSNDGIGFQAELDEGMILRVDGEWRENGEGTAETVEYDDTLRGPLDGDVVWDVASQTGVISIQGRVVNIDRQTVVKGGALPSELASADVVRVSGWRLASGEFRASLIRVQTGTAFDVDNEIELEGQVSNYTPSPCSFNIGTALVRCDHLNIQFEDISRSDLANGLFVEAEGNLVGGGSEIDALEIREDDQRRYRGGVEEEIEFAGPVSEDFTSSSGSFKMNGITVNVTSATEFDDDLIAQDLVSGLLIQVEGEFQGDGSINAEEIERRESDIKVDGLIEGPVDRVAGTFTVDGVLVQITSLTLIENDDDSPALSREQLLERLGDGVEVEVEGIKRVGSSGVFIEALNIEIEKESDD